MLRALCGGSIVSLRLDISGGAVPLRPQNFWSANRRSVDSSLFFRTPTVLQSPP